LLAPLSKRRRMVLLKALCAIVETHGVPGSGAGNGRQGARGRRTRGPTSPAGWYM
jgi:hypothetical protein